MHYTFLFVFSFREISSDSIASGKTFHRFGITARVFSCQEKQFNQFGLPLMHFWMSYLSVSAIAIQPFEVIEILKRQDG